MLSTAPNPCRNLGVLVLRTLRVIAICARPSETLETTGGAVQNLTLTLPLGFQVVGQVSPVLGIPRSRSDDDPALDDVPSFRHIQHGGHHPAR